MQLRIQIIMIKNVYTVINNYTTQISQVLSDILSVILPFWYILNNLLKFNFIVFIVSLVFFSLILTLLAIFAACLVSNWIVNKWTVNCSSNSYFYFKSCLILTFSEKVCERKEHIFVKNSRKILLSLFICEFSLMLLNNLHARYWNCFIEFCTIRSFTNTLNNASRKEHVNKVYSHFFIIRETK